MTHTAPPQVAPSPVAIPWIAICQIAMTQITAFRITLVEQTNSRHLSALTSFGKHSGQWVGVILACLMLTAFARSFSVNGLRKMISRRGRSR
jgi:uncharacterized membrane protein